MALLTGTKLGPYEIQSPLGAGGMGEVYRATDTRLSRDVAIKVLPDAFDQDSERMARFEREAKVLASLNHPNIASIYGLEESNSLRALVMELVEGLTLAERIKQRPLPLDEALPIAKKIAEGLEYAHERGIIHRDLKPSNVMVTPDGQVKILDFGLAKALEGETSEADLQNSPTLTVAATRAGALLGTAAYMSPEQARGKHVDRRADIWAFGCVLYEMLTGRGAFRGETTSDVLACVIRADPDWPALPASVPRRIRELLSRCLQKDPKQRLQAIGEARVAIEQASSGATEEVAAFGAGAVSPPAWSRALPWASGMLLALVVGIGVWELRPRPDAPQIVHFSFGPPSADSLLSPLESSSLAISRDGTEVAFMVRHAAIFRLYLRRMDRSEATLLEGTQDGAFPFFSPDGQWIGFFAGSKLKKISVDGGAPVTLCDAPAGRGGTWAPDDTIIFAPSVASGLMRVSAAGGTPQPFTKLDSSRGERSHRWPQVLPGGKAVMYATGLAFNSPIAVASLRTGETRILPIQGAYPRYVTGGYLALQEPEGVFAVPFDLQRLEVTGSRFPVLQAQNFAASGLSAYAVSETGSLAYVSGNAIVGNLAWVDRKGVLEPLGSPGRDYFPRMQVSPDGQRVAVVIQEGGVRDVWVYETRGTLTRLTFGDGDSANPVFSPDGRQIAFVRVKDTDSGILAKAANGSGSEETLLSSRISNIVLGSWSPDGKFLSYLQLGAEGKFGIWVLSLEGERQPRPLLANQFDHRGAVFSPDGKYLAYTSDETGRGEVYVMPFVNGSGKWQISTNGGNDPVWERDGKQLFYRESGNIMGVNVTTQPAFHASAPYVVVPAKAITIANRVDYFDVSADGRRFLVHEESAEAGRTMQINVILNWSEELRRRSASGKN